MIALCVIAALLAAGVLWLTFRVLRLRRSLEMERQESRRLKKLLTLGSREINAELDHMHRLRHDLRHSLPLIERSAQIPEALSLDLAATLERPIPPAAAGPLRSWPAITKGGPRTRGSPQISAWRSTPIWGTSCLTSAWC